MDKTKSIVFIGALNSKNQYMFPDAQISFVLEDKMWFSQSDYMFWKKMPASKKGMIDSIGPVNFKFVCNEYVDVDPQWEKFKVGAMVLSSLAKFSQNDAIAKKLLQTAKKKIVCVGTGYGSFWGTGKKEGEGMGDGKNMLGLVLMNIREKIVSGGIPLIYDKDDVIGITTACENGRIYQSVKIPRTPPKIIEDQAKIGEILGRYPGLFGTNISDGRFCGLKVRIYTSLEMAIISLPLGELNGKLVYILGSFDISKLNYPPSSVSKLWMEMNSIRNSITNSEDMDRLFPLVVWLIYGKDINRKETTEDMTERKNVVVLPPLEFAKNNVHEKDDPMQISLPPLRSLVNSLSIPMDA